jgi:hypothetical protein
MWGMVRSFSLLMLAFGASTALADARRDCADLSGNAAIAACDRAIRQNPKDGQSYMNRGVEYQKIDNLGLLPISAKLLSSILKTRKPTTTVGSTTNVGATSTAPLPI